MRFEKYFDVATRTNYARLNLEGLQVAELTNMPTEARDKLLSFPIETFKKLKVNESSISWGITFDVVHQFLDTLNASEAEAFVSLLLGMRYKINTVLNVPEPNHKDVYDLETDLS